MQSLKTSWLWLVSSSTDPDKYSLMIKGFVGTAATFLLIGAGVFHYTLSTGDVYDLGTLISAAVSATLTAISYVATAVSAWALVWGAIRKVLITIFGQHPLLQS